MLVFRLLAAPLRRPARFLLPVFFAGLAAAGLARFWPPRYQASALLRVERTDPGVSIERTILDTGRLKELVAMADGALEAAGGPPPESLYRLRDALSVHPRSPDLYAVEYIDDDPQRAADVLQQLTLLLTRESAVAAPAPPAADPLAEELARAKQELEEKEASRGKTSRSEEELLASSRELLVLQKRYLALLNQKMSARLTTPAEATSPRVSFRVEEPARRPDQPISVGGRQWAWGVFSFGLLFGWVSSLRGARRPAAHDPDVEFDSDEAAPKYRVEPVAHVEWEPIATVERPARTDAASAGPPDLLEPGSLFLRPNLGSPPQTAESPGPAESPDPADLPEATEEVAPGSVFLSPSLSRSAATAEADAETEPAPSDPPATDEIEAGSVILRAPQPAREASRSSTPPVQPEPPASVPPVASVEPGAVYWKTTPATATQPLPVLDDEGAKEEPLHVPTAPEANALPEPETDLPGEPEAPAPPPPEDAILPPPEPAVPKPPEPAVPQQPAREASSRGNDANVPGLVVSGGPAHGAVLIFPSSPLERLVGAAAYCHLRVDAPNVAAVHARVFWDGLGLSLSDAGSTAGTYVNGRRIAGRYPLRDGDHVSLGPAGSSASLRLLVYLPAPSEPVAPPAAGTPPAKEPRLPARAPEPESARPMTPPRRSKMVPTAVAIAIVAVGVFLGRHLLERPAPVVTAVTPARVRSGQTLFVDGSGFDAVGENNTVRLGERAVPVLSAREDRLEVEVPRDLPFALPAAVTVTVEVAGQRSPPGRLDVVAGPVVSRLEPPVAQRGDVVAALGEQLASEPVTVLVAGLAAEVVRTEPHSLEFRVPAAGTLQEGTRLPVDVWVGGEQAARVFLVVGRLPLVTEVVPQRSSAGERVTLRGFGFDPEPGGNRVLFGDKEALVLSSSPTELAVSAPASGPLLARQSDLAVTVEALGATSARASFTLLGPPSGMFVPHFYAAPVPELPAGNHAFVATELGPVMLLTGPAGTSSPAERAAAIARVLNDLVEEAAKPLALTFEVEPNPSVALAGGHHVVATATTRDALGYEGLWARLGKPGQATPHSVATHWTALLRDYLALFVQRQRPTHVLALSPRGQVLIDIYAVARKTTGGATGVPLQVFARLWPGLAGRMRDMALLVPAPGQSNPGAVIVGRWQGAMEESSKGAQPVQARFFFEGRTLAGSMTRKSPKGVAAETRLRDVSYDGDVLVFALPAGDALLHFQASLREDVIAGVIRAGTAKGAALGSFTLSYAE
jgi:hypothetical protein